MLNFYPHSGSIFEDKLWGVLNYIMALELYAQRDETNESIQGLYWIATFIYFYHR